MPTLEFDRAARNICDTADAALILDEVRAGLRLSLDASWAMLGIKPDLSSWGKAIANGEPLAAILGAEKYREAATQIFVTGSFWYQAAPMAAAIETLDLLQEIDAPMRLEALGQQLRDGLYEQAQRHGHPLRQTGPVQMPAVLFEDDAPQRKKALAFCGHLIKHGVYFHPYHNMFLSTAHTEADIHQTLAATDQAFAALG
jgi:glutamate-1-semialdehyde 2,1-aminomutase